MMRPAFGAAVLGLTVVACGSGSDEGDASGTGSGQNGSEGGDALECFGKPLPAGTHRTFAERPATLTPYSPTADWRLADPAEAGFDPSLLDQALNFSTAHSHTEGLLVARWGYVVAERYANGATADMRHESYSMAKSFSSVLIGIAIDQGLLSGTDEPICQYYSEWNCDDQTDARSRIAIDHSMNLTTGLEWHEDWRSTAQGVNDVYVGFSDLLGYTLSKPSVAEPGTVQRYSTGDPSLLSGAIQTVTGQTAYAYALDVLLRPMGLENIVWGADAQGRTTTYAGIQATLREFAKLGQLALDEGRWDGAQLVSTEWIAHTTHAEDPCKEQYRYLWHVNLPMRLGTSSADCPEILGCEPTDFANLPADGFFAEGINGQFVFVVPSAGLVAARTASDDAGSEYWDEYARGFLTLLLDAIAD